MRFQVGFPSGSSPTGICIKTSKKQYYKGTVTRHDPRENKLQSLVAQSVKTQLAANIEVKITEQQGAYNVLSSGQILSLTQNLARGDASVNESTGILIKPKKLVFCYNWSMNAVGNYNTVRCIIFRWHDASTPVPSGIIANTGTAYAPLSDLYWVNHRKITVLHDKVEELYDHGGGVAASVTRVQIDPGAYPIQLPLSGAGATPQMDGLYVLFISDDALAPNPIVDMFSRLHFTDA